MNKNYIFIGIAGIIALYAVLCLVSQSLANVVLATIIVLGGILGTLFFVLRRQLYQFSINFTPAEFRLGMNALRNQNCMVQYFPNDKLIVMDNLKDDALGKRTFTIKKQAVDVDNYWFKICRIFNKYATLDSLAAFCRRDTQVDIITLSSGQKQAGDAVPKKKKVIDSDAYNRSPETYRPQVKMPEVANFNELKQPQNVTKAEDEAVYVEDFLNMSDIMQQSASKVNINTATASEIAMLHGINIAIAKKAVEYRDLNGGFKSVDEFLQVAEVKEYFIPKIKEMITLDGASQNNNSAIEKQNEGRLLDW